MTIATLHGFLGSPALFQGVFSSPALAPWAPGAAHLWLPGHGPEPWMPGGSFDQIVDALAGRLPRGSLLLGYSQGARLAAALLARHPGRFAGAALVGGQVGLSDPQERLERARWDEEQASQIEREGLEAFVDRWERLPLFATQASLAPADLARQREARLSHRPEGVAWAMRALGLGRMPSYLGALRGLGERLLLIHGELDTKFAAIAATIALACPGARCFSIVGAGHNVPLERPLELSLLLSHLLPTLPRS